MRSYTGNAPKARITKDAKLATPEAIRFRVNQLLAQPQTPGVKARITRLRNRLSREFGQQHKGTPVAAGYGFTDDAGRRKAALLASKQTVSEWGDR